MSALSLEKIVLRRWIHVWVLCLLDNINVKIVGVSLHNGNQVVHDVGFLYTDNIIHVGVQRNVTSSGMSIWIPAEFFSTQH